MGDDRTQLLPGLDRDGRPDRCYFERRLRGQGYGAIAGVDEVGRGPLAGPVVAACVVLPEEEWRLEYDDSKKLSCKRRDHCFQQLVTSNALVGVGLVDAREIDRINILQASLEAMRRAVVDLGRQPDYLLVDGRHQVPIAVPQQPLVKGDGRSVSVAAASIIAKVTRDRLMAAYHRQYPIYNFLRHKGYPTREHRQLIKTHGPCPLHRRSFRGVREYWPTE